MRRVLVFAVCLTLVWAGFSALSLSVWAGPPSLVHYVRQSRYDPHSGLTRGFSLGLDARHAAVTSPDGRYTVAVNSNFSIVQLVLRDHAAGTQRLLPNIDNYIGFGIPVWTPDSGSFLFPVVAQVGTSDYRTSLAQVRVDVSTLGIEEVFAASDVLGGVENMIPSPDGTQVAIWDGETVTFWNQAAQQVEAQAAVTTVNLVNPRWLGPSALLYRDGDCVRAVAPGEQSKTLVCQENLISFQPAPDGERVALFTGTFGGSITPPVPPAVVIYHPQDDTARAYPLGTTADVIINARQPAWSADGDYLHLAYEYREAGSHVLLMHTSGSVRRVPNAWFAAGWETPDQLRYLP